MRKDIWELVDYARSLGIKPVMAPSVTPLLTDETMKTMAAKLDAVSISLDGARPETHDLIRGYSGVWKRTIEVIEKLRTLGLRVQVNTAVMRSNVHELPDMVALLKRLGIVQWEVFYLVPVGRAGREEDLRPEEWEDVSHFLYEASKYGLIVRTVEGPMFRRVSIVRLYLERRGVDPDTVLKPGRLYQRLVERLRQLLGPPKGQPHPHTVGTRDGLGIIFVAYNGNVYPSGFLPLPVGNVRRQKLVEIYRRSKTLIRLRSGEFGGKCGLCEFRFICGGSRARAFAYTGNPYAEDPACPYWPGSYEKLGINVREALEEAKAYSQPMRAGR